MSLHQKVPQKMIDNEGKIYLDNERVILTSSAVFGILRKDLMDNISEERMKGFLIRYGWNLGKKDAEKMQRKNLYSMEEILKKGPELHMMRGFTKAKRVDLQLDYDEVGQIERVHVEGFWSGSYEAEEFITQFGQSDAAVCYTLVGYASGYYSEICNKTVIFKEMSCEAAGFDNCYYVGKTIPEWNGTIEDELKYYYDEPIVRELETTYEKLLEERNNLEKTFAIHDRLTAELMDGNDLQSITDAIYDEIGLPIMIENADLSLLAYSGFSRDLFAMDYVDFKSKIHDRQDEKYYQMRKSSDGKNQYLIVPIMIQRKCFGFCSFVYEGNKSITKMDFMILERVASICSFYILNEKTTFEAIERIKGYFLNQIIDGSLLSEKEIFIQGQYIQVDLNKPYYIAVLKYDNKRAGSENELLFQDQLIETVQHYFKNRSNVLIGQRSGMLVLLIQIDQNKKSVREVCQILLHYIEKKYPASIFRIGVSTLTEKIQQANESYEEAITVLKMTDASDKMKVFKDISVAGLLLYSKDKQVVIQKAKHVLGEIYTKKEENVELIKTLYVFLTNGGNLEKSKEALNLSMSGLRYRIRRLEEMLGKDLRQPAVTYEIMLILQVLDAEREIELV
ncbi:MULTISPECIES: XylR N-terminal domain-containing protein [Oceanobacillus]|uniref:XylR N-terminal domain-containing protein n=1 Tax=Oceanobacillus aidingensis TaxID=645964 RepID=A0ABV9K362_9BACI|nr:XylR N-terminal domain-containing protein [Oceanobacillus oncorhynchi]MDM8099786.1 XylR N-terminal domain-containing protein [Oceanobacillus oncorhynchi]